VALAVATNIVWMAARILLETAQGLLDRTISPADQKQLDGVLAKFRGDGVEVHAVRARQSGPVRFIDMHVLVPGSWSVQRGHDLCEGIENAVKSLFPRASVMTHLEPAEDPTAWDDPESTARPT
jgi:divalent metal cation (Fe/Co/Zn/Cd) transporter